MKKIIYFLVVVVSAGSMTTSCSSDDEEGGINNADLVGKWEYFQLGEIVDGVEILVAYEHTPGCLKGYSEFTANGNGTAKSFYNDDTVNCVEIAYTFTWSTRGNKITIDSGSTATGEILTLNETTLKVKYTYEDGTFIGVYTKATN